jgi:hypothetical protein
VIDYALIGAIVVTTGFVVTLWIQKKQMEVDIVKLGKEVSINKIINHTQEVTIKELLDHRERDAKIIKQLIKDNELTARGEAIASEKLNLLESENENVRDFLNQPIPFELCPISRNCNPIGSQDNTDKNHPSPNTDSTLRRSELEGVESN